MEYYQYDARVLPEITLMDKYTESRPHRNIRRTSDEYIFYVVVYGELYLREDGREFTLKKGDCYLFQPGLLHEGTADSMYTLYYIHFRHGDVQKHVLQDEAWLRQAQDENRKWMMNAASSEEFSHTLTIPKQLHFSDPVVLGNLCRMLDRAIESQKIRLEYHPTLTACAVNSFFIELYRQYVASRLAHVNVGGESFYRMREVISFLNGHYGEKITGARLEKELSYNFDYLNQIFRRQLNTSIFQLLELIRMENALRLLLTTTWPLTDISCEVGYADENYFAKIFKKHMGITPAAYRRSSRSDKLG